MKMIIAIVSAEDAHRVSKHLTSHGFSATKLATTGGFLSTGNTTFMIGVEEEKLDEALNVIRNHSETRTRLVPVTGIAPHSGYAPAPIEVTVGGATVFVMDIEQFIKM